MILNALRISTHFVIHNTLILNAINTDRMPLYSNTYVIDTEHIADIWPCARTSITLITNTSQVYGRTRARMHTRAGDAHTCTRAGAGMSGYAGMGIGKTDVMGRRRLTTGLYPGGWYVDIPEGEIRAGRGKRMRSWEMG